MNEHCVYVIHCKENGKKYVGRTKKLNNRIHYHFSNKRKGDLRNDAERFGRYGFIVAVAQERLTEDEAIKLEGELIVRFNSLEPSGYNRSGDSEHGRILTDEHVSNLRKAHQGKDCSYKKTGKYLGAIFQRYWNVKITKGGKSIRKGMPSELDAAEAYDRLALYLHGPDAVINFENRRQEFLREDLKSFYEQMTKKRKKSKYAGVAWNEKGWWVALTYIDGNMKYIGIRKTQEEARDLRDEYRRINQPELWAKDHAIPVIEPPRIPGMNYCVYEIKNKANGKSYIGKTRNLKLRLRSHFSSSCHNHFLRDDVVKYGGRDGFEIIILADRINAEDATRIESESIAERKCVYPNGYNVNDPSGTVDTKELSMILGAVQQKRQKPNKLGVIGVGTNPSGTFDVNVKVRGTGYSKSFKTLKEAAEAYDIAVVYSWGKSATVNYPDKIDFYAENAENLFPVVFKPKVKSSQYLGVGRHASGGWTAFWHPNGTTKYIGYFKTEEEAVQGRAEYLRSIGVVC